MQNFFLQTDSTNGLQDSINGGISGFVERINPFELPHTDFVTDLAIIMILAAIVTLAFFKIKQPLIIRHANWTTFTLVVLVIARGWASD
jgi:CPA2 family monovalent cation:H+ antiporter-2